MLVRTFRTVDRLSNAFLRLSAWLAMMLVEQASLLKTGLFSIVTNTATSLVALFTFTTTFGGRMMGTARSTTQSAMEVTTARHKAHMAQRVAEAEMKPTIAPDPLLAQNRALSAFAVLLLLILLAVVVLQTTEDGNSGGTLTSGGSWPEARGTAPPTAAMFPTDIPTPTPIPDPLRVGGSLVFALRENGQENLWALGVGETNPLRLTNYPGDERDPAWSPDGTRIAFAGNWEGNWELYLMQIDTGTLTRLTYSQGFEGAPSWSPDGQYLVYEGYYPDTEDLELYIISTDPTAAASDGATRITFTPGPDIEPAWSPGGREIAFTSWRNGTNRDIYVLSLDAGGGDGAAINLTNTSDQDEDYAVWSSDASRIAYSAFVNGVEGVYVKPAQQPEASAILVGRGRMPAWAPNDASLAYVLDFNRQSQIVAGVPGNFGAATNAKQLEFRATDPDWTATELPSHFVESGGTSPGASAGALYVESERQQATGLYGMVLLNSVNAPQPYLSDRVNDSFEALRLKVLEKAGQDFLGNLEDAFWNQGRPPDPGEPEENWHYTGRAISIDRNLVYAGYPAPIEVVREDREVNVYWHVFVRVAEGAQDGTLGEPLRALPWDLTARSSGDEDDYESGGRVKDTMPPGYYIDLTQLADDYGWQRVAARRTWQYNFGAIQFWEFHKTDGKSWQEAMLEIYRPDELANFLSDATSIPTPQPLPTTTATPSVSRSPTPIPPDMQ